MPEGRETPIEEGVEPAGMWVVVGGRAGEVVVGRAEDVLVVCVEVEDIVVWTEEVIGTGELVVGTAEVVGMGVEVGTTTETVVGALEVVGIGVEVGITTGVDVAVANVDGAREVVPVYWHVR